MKYRIIGISLFLIAFIKPIFGQSQFDNSLFNDTLFYEEFKNEQTKYLNDYDGKEYTFPIGDFDLKSYSFNNGYYTIEEKSTSSGKPAPLEIPKKINETNNYAIKLKFKILNSSFNNGSGIIWSGNDQGDGFGFFIRPKSEFKISRLPGSKNKPIRDWSKSSFINDGDFNELLIVKRDKAFLFYINNKEVIQTAYEIAKGTNIMIVCGSGSKVLIDNLGIFTTSNTGIADLKLQSDVDVNIPENIRKPKLETFALIIGNEHYENAIKVDYAQRDAEFFYTYLNKSLGVSKENMHLCLNLTYGKIIKEINWIKSVITAYNGDCRIVLYYAGHGMPDEQTKEAFILPTDGEAASLISAISLNSIYKSIASKETLVFLDACFSGGSRSEDISAGRGVRLKPKAFEPESKMIIFSASSNTQIAAPFHDKKHGLFTYFLLKKIQLNKGDVALGELYNFINDNVSKKSAILGKEQSPTIIIGETYSMDWQNIKL